ncbi:MAG: EscU/YscU/HrcU family type III secretion system export apparatus switch protein [Candidatus Velthaea sp.]
MSANHEQRPHDASRARKQRAKREGNVARSAEISGVAGFAGATLAAFAATPLAGGAAVAAFRSAAADMRAPHLSGMLCAVVALAFIPAAGGLTAATGAGLMQTGGLRAVAPKVELSRLSPSAGLKRMFGGEAVVGAARALVAFVAATCAMWPLADAFFLRATTAGGAGAFAALSAGAAQRALLTALAVGGAFACADYVLMHRRWLRGIKMSHEEFRRDQKENDGDPHARSRRTQAHRTLVRGSIRRTRDASFVVVNPTHIAVAVRYAPPAVAVPEILVRAADEAALAVRALAAQHAIPVVENVPLARMLFAHGEAGRPIPGDTFVAVAYVIAALAREGTFA